MAKISSVLLMLLMMPAWMHAQDATPAQHLQQDYPKVEWRINSATTVDIDCDGKPDTFVWGIDPQVSHTYEIDGKLQKHLYPEIVLGFELGSGKAPQAINIPFLKNTGYYGLRTNPKKIEVQPLSCDWEGRPLPGCVKQDQCQSMWVKDGDRFEAYVFWDSERKAVSWVKH